MSDVLIRPMTESDLDAASRVLRRAFASFLGIPDPETQMGDADYVRTRWRATPDSAFVAESGGRVIGSNFATRWGSFAFFGPLTVDPGHQDQGIGRSLVTPAIECFERWDSTLAGLFTFAQSPKHLGLYQKFGFRPRALTLIMEKVLSPDASDSDRWERFSRLDTPGRDEALLECRSVCEENYPGLDVTGEIASIANQSLGDTLLVDGGRLGFAACHSGAGTEAGSDVCYVKFGAVGPGPDASGRFRALLTSCEALAAEFGAETLVAGVNASREEAYEEMLAAGFRIARSGVAMHRPNGSGFSKPGALVVDDWR